MKPRTVLGAIALSLSLAPSAHAADPITQVFADAPAPVTCTTQAAAGIAGERYCQGAYTGQPAPAPPTVPTTVPSWDGTPIDVSVILPPKPATGPDGNFPVIGVFHGYGGSKIIGSQTPTSSDAAQRWVAQGYAVFSITDRGFWASCGALVPVKPASCAEGYIHLMHNAYEVRDAQYLLGKLADEGVIDPTRIGATGGSYGGGMSVQLGALKNRIQLPNGSLQPWKSPQGKALSIAATVPEYGWTDLVSSLMPNGSTLDYASNNSYTGPKGDRRFGIQKQFFNAQLYAGGAQAGWYAAPGTDGKADITAWNTVNNTGGPYDGNPAVAAQIAEFPSHGAMGTDLSVAPAPALLVSGWNDDLFPVDESIRYYNKVRAAHPKAPISMYHLSIGHSPRSGSPQAADITNLYLAEYAWMEYFLKRPAGSTGPADQAGGVTITTSACTGTTPKAGATFRAPNWASLAPGEIRVDDAAAKTVAANTAPANGFQAANTNVCTEQPSADTTGAATYSTPVAPAGGYTLAGSATVIADLTVAGANDGLISRLYDVDPGAGTEKLIARGVYRPTGTGTSRQVFQLYPQAWAVAEGHQLKLELLGQDAPYARAATGQNPVGVANLQLRIPTIERAGAAGGLVKEPAEKVLPSGYELAYDLRPAVAGGGSGGGGAAPAGPTPVPTPAAAAKDPVALANVRAALLKKPSKVKYTGKSLRFTENALEAGTFTYRARLVYTTGKGKKRKSISRTLGRVTVKAKGAGAVAVTIKVSAAGRRALKAHKAARITLDTQFVTAVQGQRVDTVRKFKR